MAYLAPNFLTSPICHPAHRQASLSPPGDSRIRFKPVSPVPQYVEREGKKLSYKVTCLGGEGDLGYSGDTDHAVSWKL